MTGKPFWFSVLALSAGLLTRGVIISEAAPIPPLCDGTVQTECLLGDSGWSVTIPPNVTIKFMGLDRPRGMPRHACRCALSGPDS